MSQTFSYQRRVEFRDTDAAGIVHFSVFFAYMEQAEHEFLRSIGLGVVQEFDGRWISWPRVHASCDYRKAARFEDVLEIQVGVADIGNRSITYAFAVSRGGEHIADGKIVAACCEIKNRTIQSSVPIPDSFRARVSPYLRRESD